MQDYTERRALRSELRSLCKEEKQRQGKAVQEVVKHGSVVCATLTGVPTFHLTDQTFNVTVVDEAAQVSHSLSGVIQHVTAVQKAAQVCNSLYGVINDVTVVHGAAQVKWRPEWGPGESGNRFCSLKTTFAPSCTYLAASRWNETCVLYLAIEIHNMQMHIDAYCQQCVLPMGRLPMEMILMGKLPNVKAPTFDGFAAMHSQPAD